MKIVNKSQNTIISDRTEIADTMISRLIGLLNRPNISDGEALIITHCRSIHMFFMRFAIDVLFVDKNDRIVGLVKNIKPFRMSPYFFRSSYVVELPVGVIEKTKSQKGDLIEWQDEHRRIEGFQQRNKC